MQQQAPPQPAQPHSAALQQATRQQQAVLQMLQQQQEALKQGQDALRQEQLNLQAAAMRLREQYAALAQAQHGLQAQQKQPTSPMGSSSCNSEGAPGHMLGSISGSDDELTFSSDQLQRSGRCLITWIDANTQVLCGSQCAFKNRFCLNKRPGIARQPGHWSE